MIRPAYSLLALAILEGCTSSGSPQGVPIMQASWGEVRMSSNSSGTVVWVPMQGGRTIRLPWMRNASLIEARDGNDKRMVAALLSFKNDSCSNRSAMVMFDEAGAAAETVGECDSHIRLSETDGATVVVDDVTLAVLRVSGTELVTMREPIKKTPLMPKPEATTPAKPTPTSQPHPASPTKSGPAAPPGPPGPPGPPTVPASPNVPASSTIPALPSVPGQPAKVATDGSVTATKSTSSASSPATAIPKPQQPASSSSDTHSISRNPGLPKTIQNRY